MAQKITSAQIIAPYYYSTIGTSVAAGLKTFETITASGFTMQNTNTRIRCDKAGLYYVSYKQLISTNTNQIYYRILKNGVEVATAYPKPSVGTQDVLAFVTVPLAVNDYIELSMSATITTAWNATHSHMSIIRVG